MGVALADILAECNRYFLYNDTHALSILSTADREKLIKAALRIYSRRRPYLDIKKYTATTAKWYSLPALWEEGFSWVRGIEYPVEQTPPSLIDSKNYDIDVMVDDSDNRVERLRFWANTPSNGEVYWFKYHRRYTFTDAGASTVPISDQTGLTYLSLAQWCEALAQHFASHSDPNLENAEVIGQPSRVQEYADQAREWMKKYEKEIPELESSFYGEVGFLQDRFWDRGND